VVRASGSDEPIARVDEPPSIPMTGRYIVSVKFQKLVASAAILAAAAFVAVGCGGDDGGDGDGSANLADEQELVVNISAESEVGLFNPAGMSSLDAINSKGYVQFAGLYRIVGEDSEIEPALAADMPEVSEDGLTYTIEMRDDAEWSDGEPITAENVVTAVRYTLDPDNGAYFATFLKNIVGACESLAAGDKAALEACPEPRTDGSPEQIGVTAVDDTTLEIKLAAPIPWFDKLLTIQNFYPIRQDQLDELGADYGKSTETAVSGPFKLVEYKPDNTIVYEKNDGYYDADDVTLEKITMRMIKEPTTAVQEFTRGRLDTGLQNTMYPSAEVDKWKATDEFVSTPTVGSQYMYFNTRNKELSDPKVRQAIAQAVNRKDIVENITKKGDVPLQGVVPPAVPGFDVWGEGSQDFLAADGEPDVDTAKSMLEEAGWNEDEVLTMIYSNDGGNGQAIAELVQSNLADVGVKVELQGQPGDVLFTQGNGISPTKPSVDIVMLGWIQDYLDAQDWYQLWWSGNIEEGLNSSNYASDEYDEIYEEAIVTVDNDARYELYKQLEAKLTGPDGDMPAAPLYVQADATLVQPWVEGFSLIPSGIIYWEDVSVTER
jgi:oligopeptide transport system substrate-binding protein